MSIFTTRSYCDLGMRVEVSLERLCFYIEHSSSFPNTLHMNIGTNKFFLKKSAHSHVNEETFFPFTLRPRLGTESCRLVKLVVHQRCLCYVEKTLPQRDRCVGEHISVANDGRVFEPPCLSNYCLTER